MPELPEVETIKIKLQRFLIGHNIVDIKVNWIKTFPKDTEVIIGSTVSTIRRFGKVLVIDFENGYSLVIHIKMTGQLIYRGPNLNTESSLSKKVYGGIPGKHTHVIFNLDRSGILYYNDMRKFGWMKVVKSDELRSIALLKSMGPEPLGSLTLEIFREILNKNKKSVKETIMDQTKIGGIGNIYANDALYLAKIHPTRKANSLTEDESKLLLHSLEEVLKRGISKGGASENSYVTPDGTEGNYQDIALVYGKKGGECKNCGSIIERITLGGRGTFYCNTCQK